MCGIFGYVNYHIPRTRREILNVLIGGLQRVEYRGYDGAGLCIDSHDENRTPLLIKSVGNISNLRNCTFNKENTNETDFDITFNEHVGIGHTRWATHGVPCEKNCHPQSSNNKGFFIVHNGIITNFMPIKHMLLEKGYHFYSDTDTEVIAVLTEYIYDQQRNLSFSELAFKVIGMLEGSYGLLIKSKFFFDEMIACRKSSPLMIGISYGNLCEHVNNSNTQSPSSSSSSSSLLTELFFASDLNSFIEYTQEVIFMEDDDIAHFHKGNLDFYHITTNMTEGNEGTLTTPIIRTSKKVEYKAEDICKQGYEHFMLKEIYEQPDSVTRSICGRIDFQRGFIHFDGIDTNALIKFRKTRRFLLISCGTSYHSCLAVRSIFEELIPSAYICINNASDFIDRCPHIFTDDICIFVSQSGETADTLMALQYCKKHKATLIGITNIPGSSVLRLTDYVICLNAGVEVSVASTKAYTSQVIVLTLFALFINQENNINNSLKEINNYTYLQERRKEIINGIALLPVAITQCLKNISEDVKLLAKKWLNLNSILILGRGYEYATALESALKIKELSYIYTEGIHSGELKHGPLALVDHNTYVISFCPYNRHYEYSKNAIQQVRARHGNVVAITTREDEELINTTIMCIQVPSVVDCLQCIVNIIPMQLFAYYLALEKGLNVDCPRNLAKSVTVQ